MKCRRTHGHFCRHNRPCMAKPPGEKDICQIFWNVFNYLGMFSNIWECIQIFKINLEIYRHLPAAIMEAISSGCFCSAEILGYAGQHLLNVEQYLWSQIFHFIFGFTHPMICLKCNLFCLGIFEICFKSYVLDWFWHFPQTLRCWPPLTEKIRQSCSSQIKWKWMESSKEKQLPRKSCAVSGGEGTKFPEERAETWTINLGDVSDQRNRPKRGH